MPAATSRDSRVPLLRRLRRLRFRVPLRLAGRARLDRQEKVTRLTQVPIDVREADREGIPLPFVQVAHLDPAAAGREHDPLGVEDRDRHADLLISRGVVVDAHDRLGARHAKRLEGVAEIEPDLGDRDLVPVEPQPLDAVRWRPVELLGGDFGREKAGEEECSRGEEEPTEHEFHLRFEGSTTPSAVRSPWCLWPWSTASTAWSLPLSAARSSAE